MYNYYDSFITTNTKFVLLDNDGDIRATSFNINGIFKAREKHGWGNIHRCKFSGLSLLIGEKIE